VKNRSYWKTHYVVETNADEIESRIRIAGFSSGARDFELIYFEKGKVAPSIMISPARVVMRMSSPNWAT
jgi:hypothetical protein